ncbi:MAG: hypothetical protein ACREF3_12600, partial [Acetobacteraceae bacterium]
MSGLHRLALSLLALAGATALPPGRSPCGASEPPLLPVQQTAPADGAVINAASYPLSVRLSWSMPREPVPVRFFVEVVALEDAGPREVFASYVDQPRVDVFLTGAAAQYAWRV